MTSESCGERCLLSAPARGGGLCPECGRKGKSVRMLTVKSLIQDHARVTPGDYLFCRTPACAVVYFSDREVFRKPDVKLPVGLKETEDPVPLCYCFDYSRADILRDVQAKGSTDILKRIKTEVEAGYCACEVKNPSGACCLGDVTRAIQEAKARVEARADQVRR